jgi:hypothetical protein
VKFDEVEKSIKCQKSDKTQKKEENQSRVRCKNVNSIKYLNNDIEIIQKNQSNQTQEEERRKKQVMLHKLFFFYINIRVGHNFPIFYATMLAKFNLKYKNK